MRRTLLAAAACFLLAACDPSGHDSTPMPSTSPTTILKVDGSGNYTATFTTTREWYFDYTLRCHDAPSPDFTIADDGQPLDTVHQATIGGGGLMVHTTGVHHLAVTTACAWTLEVNS